MVAGLEEMVKSLRASKLTVGFAESCTGGLLSSSLTAMAGISDVFLGSVVSYSDSVKMDLLGVSKSALDKFGAVSVEVAKEMVVGLQARMKCDVALSVTGVAGPSGGSADKPVGTVCFCLRGPGFEENGLEVKEIEVLEKKYFKGNRNEIQRQSVDWAVAMINKNLASGSRRK